jgi:hypothetical protein
VATSDRLSLRCLSLEGSVRGPYLNFPDTAKKAVPTCLLEPVARAAGEIDDPPSRHPRNYFTEELRFDLK